MENRFDHAFLIRLFIRIDFLRVLCVSVVRNY
jgi:hypothetical protein